MLERPLHSTGADDRQGVAGFPATYLRSGALAGAIAGLVFAGAHALLIVGIWFSAPAMMLAGALCGLCVGATYGLLFATPTIRSWVLYNLTYDGLFVALAVVSLVVFEPVTTLPELMTGVTAPSDLIGIAMPATVIFTIVAAGSIGRLFSARLVDHGAVLLTTMVLVAFLGLNVSLTGLVEVQSSDLGLVVLFFGLIFTINGAYVAAFILLEWARFRRPRITREPRRGA